MIGRTMDGVHPVLWLGREFLAAERRLHNGLGYPEMRTDPAEAWESATLDWRLASLARANEALAHSAYVLPSDALDDLRQRLRKAQDERSDDLMAVGDEVRVYLDCLEQMEQPD